MGRQRSGLRLTRVGLWFLVFAVIVLLAASNTGNNGLFLVLAVMLAAWGTAGTNADLDGDGSVGSSDLAVLLAAWGWCP